MTVKEKTITKIPIIDGVLFRDVVLVAGTDNVIAHGLGREFTGMDIKLRSAECNIWSDQARNRSKSKFLHVQTSADVTVTVWIF